MGHDKLIFVDQPVDDNLVCAVCLDVCQDATTACGAGHTFCEPCLQRIKKCPTCRADCFNVPNRPLRRIIEALRVRCSEGSKDGGDDEPDKKKARTDDKSTSAVLQGQEVHSTSNENRRCGCQWEGILADLKNHIMVCPFVKMPCPLHCGKGVLRMDLEQHKEKECTYRKVQCDMCKAMVKGGHLERHRKKTCPRARVKCEFCDEEMDREDLGQKVYMPKESFPGIDRNDGSSKCTGHYAECPKMLLCCEFYERGCNAKFTRDRAAAHHAENAQYHAALVDRTLDRLYDWLDWDVVRIAWTLKPSEIMGSQHKVLMSKTVTGVSSYELYLKLYLEGPDDPIKIAICSRSINICPIYPEAELRKINIQVADKSLHLPYDFAKIYLEKEVKIKPERGRVGVFEFSTVVKKDETACTRSGLLQSLDEMNIVPSDLFSIRAAFCIHKVKSVMVQSAG